MAYADPQSVTVNGSASALARTSFGSNSGAFTKDDGTVKLEVSHQYGKRTRRSARVTTSKIASDPLNATQNLRLSASVYIVVDVPVGGFTATEQKDLITSLTTWLTASTNANALKLVGGEV